MSGPDATLRAKGARLVDQLRRDLLPTYTEAREREAVFGSCKGSGRNMWNRYEDLPCDRCGGDSRVAVQCDPLDVARLLAFCGDEEASEVAGLGVDRGGGAGDPGGSVAGLCSGTARLSAKLPPKRAEVECDDCDGRGVTFDPEVMDARYDCKTCNGTGKVAHDTPAERWLLVVAAEAVARECLQEVAEHEKRAFVAFGRFGLAESRSRHGDTFAQREAIDACRAWIAEPTPANWEAWARSWIDSGRQEWLLAATQDPCSALFAASDVIDPDRVREIASRAIREAVRGG